jgi:hypothetical protein
VVSSLIDNYADSFAVVEYHVSDAYAAAWGEARGGFYSIWSDGIPWFAYDGLFDAWPISMYEPNLQARLAVPAPVTMDVAVTPLSDDMYEIATDLCLEDTADAMTVRVYAVVVEDRWPTTPSYSRNTFRVETPTADILLEPGRCYRDTREVRIDPGWNPDNVKVIAWAQAPLDHIPAEVYQAAKAYGPFDQLMGDVDGDGDVDLGDLAALLAAYETCDGDPLYNPAADLDDSGCIDLGDLAILLSVYGTGT